MAKSAEAFKTISEVAQELDVPKHVLRFWEAKFPHIRPMKRGGGRRYYRPNDVELLRGICRLLHQDGYTIKGVQRIMREQGVEGVKRFGTAPPASEPETARPTRSTPGRRGAPAAEAPRNAAADPPASRAAAGASARPDPGRTIAAAISELKACRALLTAPIAAASSESSPRAA